MTPRDLLAAFDVLAEAPDGVARLRELVLQLAVRGKLVPQDPEDEPATVFVSSLADRRAAMVESGVIQAPRHPLGMDVERPPHEIPENWCWVRLGDVGAIVGGGTPKSSEPSYWSDGEGVPWLTPADMAGQPSRYIVRGRRDISDEGLARSAARLLPTGTVLFSSRAPIGHVGIAASPIATNQGFKSCVPYHPDLSEYLFVYLKKAAREIDEAATGTTFKEVSGKEVSLVPVPVPPLAEQRRIVTRVDELMSLLDRLEAARTQRDAARAALRDAALAALRDAEDADAVEDAWARVSEHMADLFVEPRDVEPLRQTILHLAVRGRLVPQDPEDEPASALLARIKAEKAQHALSRRPQSIAGSAERTVAPFAPPSGWAWCRMDDIFLVSGGIQKSGKRRPTTNAYPYLRVANVQRGLLDLTDVRQFQLFDGELERYRLRTGDLLIVEGNGSESEIGRGARWNGELADCVHQNHLIRCRPLQLGYEQFVLSYLNAPIGTSTMRGLAVTTSGLFNLSVGKIRRITLPLPPISEQRRIMARLATLMAICDRWEAHLSVARTAHQHFAAAAVHRLDA